MFAMDRGLHLSSDQPFRAGPPRASVVLRPGAALTPGEERYTVQGSGVIAVPIHAGDRLRVIDLEGMQRCDLVASDAAGVIDSAILGARGDGDASGLKRALAADTESARAVRAALERRGIDFARARAVTLFGGDSRPGASAEFAVARDGLLIAAAPGAQMEAGAQDTATPIRLHIQRSRIARPNETPLPEPLAEPLHDIRVNQSTAEAYFVRAGEYIQIIDVAGRQCTDFQCFAARKLDKGVEHPLDVTTTRSLIGQSYPLPGLLSKAFDETCSRWSRWCATRSAGTTPSRSPATPAITTTRAIPAMSTAPTISMRSLPLRHRPAQRLDGAQLLLQHRDRRQ
jgi:aminomethyltransferase